MYNIILFGYQEFFKSFFNFIFFPSPPSLSRQRLCSCSPLELEQDELILNNKISATASPDTEIC